MDSHSFDTLVVMKTKIFRYTFLLCALITSLSLVASSSVKKSFIHSHLASYINQPLIQDFHKIKETDKHIAKFVTTHGGGVWDKELNAIVPYQPELIEQHLQLLKDHIALAIGQITPAPTDESKHWLNDAKSLDELIEHATLASKELIPLAKQISEKNAHVIANFGPNNLNAVKSLGSMQSKEKRISLDNPVEHIKDAVRGTLITENVQDLLSVIAQFKEEAIKKGWKIVFSNIWKETLNSGYVGIHAKLYIPIQKEGVTYYIQGEMQFHFKAIYNGTFDSPKEKGHELYMVQREDKLLEEDQIITSASRLIYLTAMDEISSDIDSTPVHQI